MFTPIDQARDLRYAEDIEVIVRLFPDDSAPGGRRVTTDIHALDKLVPGEEGLNIHGDRVFEMLIYALWHHCKNEMESGCICCPAHFFEQVQDLFDRIAEDDDEVATEYRRVEH